MKDNRKGLYIPPRILSDGQIGSTQKIVYATMVAEMGEDNICRLSSRQLAEKLGMTAPTAQNARLALVNRGYIQPVPRSQCNYRILHFRKKRREEDNA